MVINVGTSYYAIRMGPKIHKPHQYATDQTIASIPIRSVYRISWLSHPHDGRAVRASHAGHAHTQQYSAGTRDDKIDRDRCWLHQVYLGIEPRARTRCARAGCHGTWRMLGRPAVASPTGVGSYLIVLLSYCLLCAGDTAKDFHPHQTTKGLSSVTFWDSRKLLKG